jgi:signal peptidase
VTFLRRHLAKIVLAVHLAGWLALLWPHSLGGGVSYVMVVGRSMEPGLHTGDLVVVQRARSYDVGDVIAYRVPDGQPGAGATIIHRITGGSEAEGYITQGDNRSGADAWRPGPGDVLGRRWVLVPRAGWALAGLQSPLPLATLAGLLTAWVAFGGGGRQSARRRTAHAAAPSTASAPAPIPTGTAMSLSPSPRSLAPVAVPAVVVVDRGSGRGASVVEAAAGRAPRNGPLTS